MKPEKYLTRSFAFFNVFYDKDNLASHYFIEYIKPSYCEPHTARRGIGFRIVIKTNI